MKIVKSAALAVTVLGLTACGNFDIKNLTNLAKMMDSKEVNFHDIVVSKFKTSKTPASNVVDSYMSTFFSADYDKFKDDELSYDKEIKSSTERLQNTIDKFELKPYKAQYNVTFGKYDTKKECFNVPDLINEDGYLSDGNYWGLQLSPLVINSDKSKTKILDFAKLRPKDASQITCLKVPLSLAKQITSLGDETSRNTEVRLDFDITAVNNKTMTFHRPKAPTKLQYRHNINPGSEDVKEQGYEVVFNVKTIRVMKPGYSDQVLNVYNLEK